MTNSETNDLMMFESVDAHLDKWNNVIKNIPSVLTAHQELKGIILEIRTLVQTQSKSTKAEQADKKVLFDRILNGVKKIRTGILAHAAATNSNAFGAIEDIKPSELDKMRNSKTGRCIAPDS